MSKPGQIETVKVIKKDGTEHTVKLQTIGVKRDAAAAAPQPATSAETIDSPDEPA